MIPPRIAVLILTRGRPGGLVAAVRALHATASGDVPVQYVICADDDDETIPAALELLDGLPVGTSIYPRPDALGQAWNLGAQAADPWDLAMLTGDDVVPLTWHWDRHMAGLWPAHTAFAWTEINDPSNITYPVLARSWHDALGQLVPEIFPYWFNDTWINEVHALAFGAPVPVYGSLCLGGRRGTTREMRELGFWFGVFAQTRPLRLEQAATLARHLGRRPPDNARLLTRMAEWDTIQAARVPQYCDAFGADQVPPTPRYRRARARAEALLQTLGATVAA